MAIGSANAIGLVAIGGWNAIGLIAIGGANSIGVVTIGGLNSMGLVSFWRGEQRGLDGVGWLERVGLHPGRSHAHVCACGDEREHGGMAPGVGCVADASPVRWGQDVSVARCVKIVASEMPGWSASVMAGGA